MDALRTLEILISSRTPLIAIETLEEERVEQALERVAQVSLATRPGMGGTQT